MEKYDRVLLDGVVSRLICCRGMTGGNCGKLLAKTLCMGKRVQSDCFCTGRIE